MASVTPKRLRAKAFAHFVSHAQSPVMVSDNRNNDSFASATTIAIATTIGVEQDANAGLIRDTTDNRVKNVTGETIRVLCKVRLYASTTSSSAAPLKLFYALNQVETGTEVVSVLTGTDIGSKQFCEYIFAVTMLADDVLTCKHDVLGSKVMSTWTTGGNSFVEI